MGKDMDLGLYDFEIKNNTVYLASNQVLVLLCSHYPKHNKFKDKVVDLKNAGHVIRCSPEVYGVVNGYYKDFRLFMDAMDCYPETDIARMLQDPHKIWPGTDFLINRITDKQTSELYLEEKFRHLEKLESGLRPNPTA